MKKKITLLILFFLSLNSLIQAQTYYPIPTDSSYKWYQTEYYKSGGGGGGYFHYFKKDTIMNGKQYFIDSREHTFFREENKKCYIWDTLFINTETLVYDFNLVKGDTFIVSGAFQFLTDNRDTLIVDSIGSTLVAGTNRKTWYFESVASNFTPFRFECEDPSLPSYSWGYNWWNFKWIEGVGCNMSFYWMLYSLNLCNETDGYCISCMSYNDSLYYETDNQFIHDSLPSLILCGKTVSMSKSENDIKKLIYSSDLIQSGSLGQLTIYNQNGQIVKHTIDTHISTSELQSGLYFCTFQSVNNFLTLKFFKQ